MYWHLAYMQRQTHGVIGVDSVCFRMHGMAFGVAQHAQYLAQILMIKANHDLEQTWQPLMPAAAQYRQPKCSCSIP